MHLNLRSWPSWLVWPPISTASQLLYPKPTPAQPSPAPTADLPACMFPGDSLPSRCLVSSRIRPEHWRPLPGNRTRQALSAPLPAPPSPLCSHVPVARSLLSPTWWLVSLHVCLLLCREFLRTAAALSPNLQECRAILETSECHVKVWAIMCGPHIDLRHQSLQTCPLVFCFSQVRLMWLLTPIYSIHKNQEFSHQYPWLDL